MTPPRISVITPSFNQGEYIERTIDSVLSQGYSNLEYIIVDGGSTDKSVEVIRRHERHLAYWVSEKDRGQSHAINKGMARASGEVLTWLNSDDWHVNNALFVYEELFRTDPDCRVVIGRGQIVDERGMVVVDKSPDAPIDMDWLCRWVSGNYFMQPSCAFTREAWLAVGGLRESIHMAMDLDLWLRFAAGGFKFATTERLLSLSLTHPNAKTTAFAQDSLLDAARVIGSFGRSEGYETLVERLMLDVKYLRHKVGWFERNYELIAQSTALKVIHPLVKLLSSEGRYWQRQMPPWKE